MDECHFGIFIEKYVRLRKSVYTSCVYLFSGIARWTAAFLFLFYIKKTSACFFMVARCVQDSIEEGKHLISKVVGCVKKEPEQTLTIHVTYCCIV